MMTMFLDESGDHSLEKVDPEYPVFVLGGIIVEDFEMGCVIEPAFQRFKREFLKSGDTILHTSEITRNKGAFEAMKNPEFRIPFIEALNSLMESLPYMVVACAIRKDRLIERYRDRARNPYNYALHVLVERFVMELSTRKANGRIIAEARDTAEDRRLLEEWKWISERGTYYESVDNIARHIHSFSIIEKKRNICGLQLADLIVSPIGRAVIGKKMKKDWDIISRKFRRGEKGADGYGLIVLPK